MLANKLFAVEGLATGVELTMKSETHLRRRDKSLLDPPFLISYDAFLSLFEQHPNPMWIYDLKTLRFLAVNDAAIRNYLYSREEFENMMIAQLDSTETSHTRAVRLADALPESGSPGIWQHRRKNGTTLEAEITSDIMMFNGRKACLVLASDVTRRERTREALQETQERYRDLFDHSSDIVFSTDLNGKFTSLNKAGEMVTGFSSEEAQGMDVARILGPRSLEVVRDLHAERTIEGRETRYEIEIARKDGQLITLAMSTSLTRRDGQPTGVRGIARDITEQKQLEERLRQSQKMEALGRLAGGIAHDFNNLLGVIIGYGEILADRLGLQDPLCGFAGETLKAGRQAASLTQQLLAFSRKQVLQPKILDLNASIAGVEQLLRRLLREDIDLVFTPSAELGRVKADPGQIQQVIMNLAVNARDAMPQGGELRIETANVDREEGYTRQDPYVAAGHYVLLTVSDAGIGMDEKTRARIFEPFFTTKQFGNGTGLGLATVYGIVKQSGGYISVQSQPGKGCSFKIFLPRVKDAEVVSTAGGVRTEVLTGYETVLLVEDAEPFRKLVRMLLETSGYTVLEARTCTEAAQLAAQHRGSINLLLTDIVMPQIDGYQLSDHVRFLRPEIKVLYMSGYAAAGRSGQAQAKFGDRVLPKPFCKDALLLAVRQMLDEAQKHGEMRMPDRSLSRLSQNCAG
jgi:two-component system cell cycle sensor histidine kinase/response regulator CckA